MEAFALYLLKSVIWLTGFTLIYFLFLRNERFFRLKRCYLIAGILISFIFPLFTFHYQVEIPAPEITYQGIIPPDNGIVPVSKPVLKESPYNFKYVLFLIYLTGILFLVFKAVSNTGILIRTIKKTKSDYLNHARLIRDMMKTTASSPYRKMKIFLVLPLIAVVFYAFATPKYNYLSDSEAMMKSSPTSEIMQKEAKGTVVNEAGKPLSGVKVIVTNSAMSVLTDSNGKFAILRVPDGSSIIFTYKGYKTYILPPLMTSNTSLYVKLVKDPDYKEKVELKSSDGSQIKALVVVDGIISGSAIGEIDSDSILSIVVLKNEAATDKYGDKGKDGVIEITTKKKLAETNDNKPNEIDFMGSKNQQQPEFPIVVGEEPFVVVEEMPMYPGGEMELLKFIAENTQYPEAAKAEKIEGKVIIRFIVNTEGNTEGFSVLKGVHPLLDAEAVRVVSMLSGFKPGMQNRRAVPVWYMVPVNFALPN